MKPTDAAYLAALIDGEGTITLQQGRVRITVTMADFDVIERAWQASGCQGSVIGPLARPDGHKEMYSWYVCGHERVQAVVAAIWPWLGARRRMAASVALAEVTARYRVRMQRREAMQIAPCSRCGERQRRQGHSWCDPCIRWRSRHPVGG